MKKISWIILFLIITFIESIITTLPLVLLFILIYCLLRKKITVYVLGFLAGIILDIFSVRMLGQSSLFFLVFLLMVNLYENKFETLTFPFVIVFSFLGSAFYLKIFDYNNIFIQSLLISLLGFIAVKLLIHFNTRRIDL